jgi:alkaline phosphatase
LFTGLLDDLFRAFVVIVAVLLIAVIILTSIVAVFAASETNRPKPSVEHKNLIIMIGDGFGPASVTMGRTCKGAPLNLDSYQTGMIRTRSSQSWVTDSAAGATSYSCGIRTYNAAIAVDDDHVPCGTIFEAARAKGMALGAVVTSRVTHATPAAFTSHAVERDDEDFIAEQQLTQGLDVLLGGGRNFFDPTVRPDGKDLIQQAKDDGYTVVLSKQDFETYSGDGPLFGLFSKSHMDYEIDRVREQTQPSLVDMTRKALDILSKKTNGFILLVEGSRIDHAGHGNDGAAHVQEILSYDEAAKLCFDFAMSSQNTLVVSTADHETGGMSLALQLDVTEEAMYNWYPDVLLRVNASAEFMADEVLSGNSIIEVLELYAGFDNVSIAELDFINSFNYSSSLLEYAIAKVISDRALVGWATHGHSGIDVDLFAYSPYGRVPSGNMVNSDLGLFLASEFGLDLAKATEAVKDFNPVPARTHKRRKNLHFNHN